MTDPVTNVEIEDVLSSIRRLVSEDSRTAPKRDKPIAEEAPAADKLVLTPALRVADDAPPATTDGTADDTVQESAQPVETSPQPSADEQEETTGETDLLNADRDTLIFKHAMKSAREEAEFVHVSQDADSLAERIANLEAEVAGRQDQWEPDGDTGDDYAGAPVEATLPWEDSAPEEFGDDDAADGLSELIDAQVESQGEATCGTAITDSPVEDSAGYDTDEIGAEADNTADVETPETAFMTDEWPEAEGAEEVASNAAVFSTQNRPALGPEGEQEPVETAADPDPTVCEDDQITDDDLENDPLAASEMATSADSPEIDLFAADEAILDEDTLREMVADIVRQELQGALGERITRNVRKLVRREIHRALASHELD